MSSDWVYISVLSTVCLGGVAVVVGAWLPKGKKLPDWFMAIGDSMALVAFAFMTAMILGGLPALTHGDEVAIVVLAMIALGILLFSMGYVMDRWRRRREGSLPMQVR